MKLALGMMAINQPEVTRDCLESFRTKADNWHEIELKIVDNGSVKPVTECGFLGIDEPHVIRNEQNVGVPAAMNQIYHQTTADLIVVVHNDVIMHEQGWDTKLIRILSELPQCGVAGFWGAKGLGTSDLYIRPYQMSQFIRIENVASCPHMSPGHGQRPVNGELERVTMMDGFSLIFNRKFLDQNNGFDLNLPPMHMYDADICLDSLDWGFENYVIAMDAEHLSGYTDCKEDWTKNTPGWEGVDRSEVHRLAHYPYFYNKWSPQGAEEREKQGRLGITLPQMVR